MFDLAIAWLVSRLKAADISIIMTVHDVSTDPSVQQLWVERIDIKRVNPGYGAIVKVDIVNEHNTSTTTGVSP